MRKIRTQLDYFERKAELRYPWLRGRRLLVGYGAIETGRRAVISCRRPNQSGMLCNFRLPGPPGRLTSNSLSRTRITGDWLDRDPFRFVTSGNDISPRPCDEDEYSRPRRIA